MSAVGQTEKNPVRAYIFRFALDAEWCSPALSCLEAPLVKGVLQLCERLGCGHVFGLFALGKDPLALMIRPLGSLPQSPYRTRLGADSASGFRALSVGSHHPLVTLDCVSPESKDTARNVIGNLSLL
jgi:hypothetical protein